MAAAEFPEYAIAFSKGAREIRKGLSDDASAVLTDIEDLLVENPDGQGHRVVTLAEDMFIYRHPGPKLELTCKVDRDRQVIHVLHVVVPQLDVTKPLFISYSHADEDWLTQLRKFLKPLEARESITIWDDREIKAGASWREEIEKNLASAKAALLLVSQNFIASDFISDQELPKLLKAARENGVDIFWVAVSASTVEDTELFEFQAVNDPMQPLDSLKPAERQKQFVDIYKRIKEVVEA